MDTLTPEEPSRTSACHFGCSLCPTINIAEYQPTAHPFRWMGLDDTSPADDEMERYVSMPH